jgi:hypothetical protein
MPHVFWKVATTISKEPVICIFISSGGVEASTKLIPSSLLLDSPSAGKSHADCQ